MIQYDAILAYHAANRVAWDTLVQLGLIDPCALFRAEVCKELAERKAGGESIRAACDAIAQRHGLKAGTIRHWWRLAEHSQPQK